MLELNNCTLVCIDCVQPDIALRALEQTCSSIKFNRVVLFTDTKQESNFEIIQSNKINSLLEYCHFVIYELPKYINTDFCMINHHDGWVVNPHLWLEDFLKYDYIGAPWKDGLSWTRGFRVGNGGVSIRSKLLMDFVSKLSCLGHEDSDICCVHRPILEQNGFKFAPLNLASKFCVEQYCDDLGMTVDTCFAFHGKEHSPEHIKQINRLHLPIKRLISESTRGFFSYVFQALTHYSMNDSQYYIDYNYTPYNDPAKGQNMWAYYFDQIINPSTNAESKEWFHPYNIPQRLTKEDRSKYHELITKFIKIKPEIMKKAQNFFTDQFHEASVLGVHRRGTDHKIDGPILSIEHYFKEVDKIYDQFNYLFVMSDEQQTIDAFKNRYRNCVAYNSIRSLDNQAIHFGIGKKDPYRMGEDVLVESIILSKCSHIIRTVSGVSIFSLMLNPDLSCTDIDKGIIYG